MTLSDIGGKGAAQMAEMTEWHGGCPPPADGGHAVLLWTSAPQSTGGLRAKKHRLWCPDTEALGHKNSNSGCSNYFHLQLISWRHCELC